MLPLLNLQLSSLPVAADDGASTPLLPSDAIDFSARLQEQLELPALFASGPDILPGGDLLPLAGKGLPRQPGLPDMSQAEVAAALDTDELQAILPDTTTPVTAAPASTIDIGDTRIPWLLAPAMAATMPADLARHTNASGMQTPVPSTAPLLAADLLPGIQLQSGPVARATVDIGPAAPATDLDGPMIAIGGDAASERLVLRPTVVAPPNTPGVATGVPVSSSPPLVQRLQQDIRPAAPVSVSISTDALASAFSQASVQSATAATPPTVTTAIDIPVPDRAWGAAINERVLLMAARNQQNAEIRLSPPDLGPLRVQVTFEDGAAEVTFTAQHLMTREAIESALPRLRELFTSNGLALGNASVSDQGIADGRHDSETVGNQSAGQAEDASESGASDVPGTQGRRQLVSNALIDTFV